MKIPYHILPMLLFAACAAPIKSPPPLQSGGWAARSLEVAALESTKRSRWEWSIKAPDGDWRLICQYKGGGHHASVRFPGGSSLPLPEKAVTAACRAISEGPEASAWISPDGTTHLSIGGTITLTSSQGIFAIRERKLQGYRLSETTAGTSEGNFQQSYSADGTPIAD